MKPFVRAAVVAALTCLALLSAAPAFAHEDRVVGDYEFVVGFLNEPVFAGDKSGVSVAVAEAGSAKPVADGVELEAEVLFGDESVAFPLEAQFGAPGSYAAEFFPTRPGQYTFHITGTVGGQEIDEEFTSGPETFGDVADPGEVSFPVQDPSTGELNQRLDQELPRVTSAVEDAQDSADGSKTLTFIALAAAVLALLLALVALARGRSTG